MGEKSEAAERPTDTTIGALKRGYYVHLKTMNPGAADEGTYRASCFYYRAELLPLLPPDKNLRILDVGCGFGHLIRFCHEQGYRRMIGVEIDEQLFQAAKAYVGGRAESIINADATQFLQEHCNSFDLITLFDVIEHFRLEEAVRVAERIRRALRPGGLAVFRTPNMANLFGAYSRYLDLTHQCGYTEQSLAQLLRQAGFSDPRLCLPEWDRSHSLSRKLRISRWMHQLLFRSQDRTKPRCFEKNIVMWARVPGSPQ